MFRIVQTPEKPKVIDAKAQGVPQVRQKEISSFEKRKKPIALFVILGLLIFAAIGFAFWLGQKDTIKITREDKAMAPITEKMMRGESLSPAEQRAWEERQKELSAGAEKFFKQDGKSVVPVAPAAAPVELPAGVKPGSWEKTFQTKYGPIAVKYTDKTNKRIAVWMEVKDGYLNRNAKNVSDKPITGNLIFIEKDAKGKTYSPLVFELKLGPGQTETDQLGSGFEIKSLESYFEITK